MSSNRFILNQLIPEAPYTRYGSTYDQHIMESVSEVLQNELIERFETKHLPEAINTTLQINQDLDDIHHSDLMLSLQLIEKSIRLLALLKEGIAFKNAFNKNPSKYDQKTAQQEASEYDSKINEIHSNIEEITKLFTDHTLDDSYLISDSFYDLKQNTLLLTRKLNVISSTTSDLPLEMKLLFSELSRAIRDKINALTKTIEGLSLFLEQNLSKKEKMLFDTIERRLESCNDGVTAYFSIELCKTPDLKENIFNRMAFKK